MLSQATTAICKTVQSGRMLSPIWDIPHLADGAPEPESHPDKVTVFNMR